MGMTREEAIEWIEALVETMLHETSVGSLREPEYRDEVYEALNMAMETARKYQKIQEIVNSNPDYIHHTDMDTYKLNSIRKVVEDGNND